MTIGNFGLYKARKVPKGRVLLVRARRRGVMLQVQRLKLVFFGIKQQFYENRGQTTVTLMVV